MSLAYFSQACIFGIRHTYVHRDLPCCTVQEDVARRNALLYQKIQEAENGAFEVYYCTCMSTRNVESIKFINSKVRISEVK